MQQREADKISVVLCPWQVLRHLSGSSVPACIALRLRTEYTGQSGNFGPCQEVGVYFVMMSRLLAQVHQLDVSVCQSFRDSRKEREVRPCAVIMRWVTSCKQNKSSKPSHCSVPPNCVKFLLSKRHSETMWVPWTPRYNQQARRAELLAESNRLQSHTKQDILHADLRTLTVVTTVTYVPMVGMITYVVTTVTSVPMGTLVTLVTKGTNILMVKGKR